MYYSIELKNHMQEKIHLDINLLLLLYLYIFLLRLLEEDKKFKDRVKDFHEIKESNNKLDL